MILQEPRWETLESHYGLLVSINDGGKTRVVRVVTTQMLSTVADELRRGSNVKLTGQIRQSRKEIEND